MAAPEVRIRRTEPRDAFAVAALTLQADREAGATTRPGFLDEFADAWLADRRRVAWLAQEVTGRPVGLVHAAVIPGLPSNRGPATNWLDLSQLFVVPDRRGEGIAAELLATLVGWARHEGTERIQVRTTAAQRSVHLAAGFVEADGSLLDLDLRAGVRT